MCDLAERIEHHLPCSSNGPSLAGMMPHTCCFRMVAGGWCDGKIDGVEQYDAQKDQWNPGAKLPKRRLVALPALACCIHA